MEKPKRPRLGKAGLALMAGIAGNAEASAQGLSPYDIGGEHHTEFVATKKQKAEGPAIGDSGWAATVSEEPAGAKSSRNRRG